ncbi:putative RNA recognition domain containing protein [Blattamonas nauphoetae]|uniref:RNA recognition domain containing protein n=1 Tax=Blattamonas nauphoetae TaxID=2049346 RepID=A0ABQ9XF61_9EUKA|nr:putative RNA recognition domain containing protein [Blattamonas nauphoetae]
MSIQPIDSFNIFVSLLPLNFQDEELLGLFSQFGSVESAHVMINAKTGLRQRYGFVKFHRNEDAAQAIQCLNGFRFGQDELVVRYANAMKEKPSYAPIRTVRVVGIHPNVNEAQLSLLFGQFGEIQQIRLLPDYTAKPTTAQLAYIRFSEISSSKLSVEHFQRSSYSECGILGVEFAKTDLHEKHVPGGGDREKKEKPKREKKEANQPLPKPKQDKKSKAKRTKDHSPPVVQPEILYVPPKRHDNTYNSSSHTYAVQTTAYASSNPTSPSQYSRHSPASIVFTPSTPTSTRKTQHQNNAPLLVLSDHSTAVVGQSMSPTLHTTSGILTPPGVRSSSSPNQTSRSPSSTNQFGIPTLLSPAQSSFNISFPSPSYQSPPFSTQTTYLPSLRLSTNSLAAHSNVAAPSLHLSSTHLSVPSQQPPVQTNTPNLKLATRNVQSRTSPRMYNQPTFRTHSLQIQQTYPITQSSQDSDFRQSELSSPGFTVAPQEIGALSNLDNTTMSETVIKSAGSSDSHGYPVKGSLSPPKHSRRKVSFHQIRAVTHTQASE